MLQFKSEEQKTAFESVAKLKRAASALWDPAKKGADYTKMADAHEEAKVRYVFAWNSYAQEFGGNFAKVTDRQRAIAAKLKIS